MCFVFLKATESNTPGFMGFSGLFAFNPRINSLKTTGLTDPEIITAVHHATVISNQEITVRKDRQSSSGTDDCVHCCMCLHSGEQLNIFAPYNGYQQHLQVTLPIYSTHWLQPVVQPAQGCSQLLSG